MCEKTRQTVADEIQEEKILVIDSIPDPGPTANNILKFFSYVNTEGKVVFLAVEPIEKAHG